MPLAYYSVAAEQQFWSEHWGGHSLEELLRVARRSPLTTLITRALPRDGRVLEAGCGLGQYVVVLREQGWRAIGVDQVVDALARCHRAVPVPLAASDLGALAVRDASLAAYVSLGVVEHEVAGPDAILAEARRVLAPGGVLVVSVPYLNGVRRLGSPYLRYRSRAVARQGGRFYQYAFSRGELVAALARHGFATRMTHPYDPARVLRRLMPGRWRPGAGSASAGGTSGRAAKGRAGEARDGTSDAATAPTPGGVADGASSGGTANATRETRAREERERRSRGGLETAARRLLYAPPMLRLLGHMLLAVAVKT